MWEVASLTACHSLHTLFVAEVPTQSCGEAHKAPHCEVPGSSWGGKGLYKGSSKSEVFILLLGWVPCSLKNTEALFSVNYSFPGSKEG